ncbi:MAG: DUF6268 family outer membrane beta-barrel protein [Candidatus Binatia bacterium]
MSGARDNACKVTHPGIHQGRAARLRWPTAVAALAIALALPVPGALAQDAEETLDEESVPQAGIVGEAGYAWQGKADIDGGGDMSVNRFDVGLLGRLDLMDRVRWQNSFFFSVNDYDFGGGGFGAGDPWNTIMTMRMVTQLRYALTDQWGISAGGVFIFSPESGANWGDSFSGGGLLGVDYTMSKTLFVSLGAAVISQIEDDARITPSIILNWVPRQNWAVRVGAVPASGGAAAAGEVAYKLAEPVEIGLGLLYNQRRFRLNDDGVGEDNNMPLRLRLGWCITDQISLNLLAGVALAGDVQIDDSRGNTLNDQDYDPAPYIGARFVGGF